MAIAGASMLASILFMLQLEESGQGIALRSSGLPFFYLFFPPFLVSLVFCSLCFFAGEVASGAKTHQRGLVKEAVKHSPAALLRLQIFPNTSLWWQNAPYHPTLLIGEENGQEFLLSGSMESTASAIKSERLSWISCKNQRGAPPFFPEIQIDAYEDACLELKALALLEKPSQEKPRYLLSKTLWKRRCGDEAQKHLHELFRRISLSLSPCTLTFLGMAMILGIERLRRPPVLAKVFACFLLFFLFYFLAKLFKESAFLSSLFFCLNHLLLLALGAIHLHQYRKGLP